MSIDGDARFYEFLVSIKMATKMLPDEIYASIFQFADYKTICSLLRTCKKFRKLITTYYLCKHLKQIYNEPLLKIYNQSEEIYQGVRLPVTQDHLLFGKLRHIFRDTWTGYNDLCACETKSKDEFWICVFFVRPEHAKKYFYARRLYETYQQFLSLAEKYKNKNPFIFEFIAHYLNCIGELRLTDYGKLSFIVYKKLVESFFINKYCKSLHNVIGNDKISRIESNPGNFFDAIISLAFQDNTEIENKHIGACSIC